MWTSSRPGGRELRPVRLVLPLLLIIVGIIFLLNNLGVIPWSVWFTLARLWPVILILLGIDILLGRRGGPLGAVITALVLIAILAGVVGFTSFTSATPAGTAASTAPSQQRTMSVPLGSASSGDVSLTFPAGALTMSALPTKGTKLLELTGSMPTGMSVNVHSSIRGDVAEAVLSTSGDRMTWWPFGGTGSRNVLTWDVRLVPGVPLSIRINTGAGESTLDLTNVTVRQLTMNSGAGQTTIHFPANAGQTDADIHAGAGQLTLIIPPDVGAYIHRSGAIVDVHVPSGRFQQVSDGYQTENYSTATNRLDLTLHLGVGSVDVQ
jgi:hypothetical protein